MTFSFFFLPLVPIMMKHKLFYFFSRFSLLNPNIVFISKKWTVELKRDMFTIITKILNFNFLLFSSKIKRRQLYLKFEYFMIIIFSECVNLQSEN